MAKKFGFTGTVFLLLYSVITWGVIAGHEWVQRFDYALTALIQGRITEDGADFVAVATDIAGFPPVFVLTMAVVLTLLIKKMYIASLWFGLTVYICASLLMDTMKAVIGRERPDLLVITMESSMSYPSGHSISSVMLYGFVGLILMLVVKKLWQKIVIGGIAGMIILFVLTSRVYLGVHYPSDTIGGFTFGMAGIFISISLYQLALPGIKRWMDSKKWRDRSPDLSA
ncbi:phosphatase PAP2 family protein [Lacicoccus qingdaonensis]|uniref:Undecaprenyl-diphosphatase n=1 Tax=Lacicoccus qingdaonensis TaxID=576118 RepID=A0A1G9FEU6_9BACL|nr:phosphatase PAP2 family protein [Salinicoccus qingdaonensis]SDK86961.1 undecaprenyl-diphosphatase [Salinicoccus qingdaonensis]